MLVCQQFLIHQQQIYDNLRSGKNSTRHILALQTALPEIFFQINVPRFRSVHRRERHDNSMWFLEQEGNAQHYYESYRMDKNSFQLLCEKLAPYLPCPAVFVTPPLPIPKQVALCLYKLATCAEYRVVGDVFGVHKSTVHKYFHLVVKAILQLRREFLYFPALEEAKKIAAAFEKLTNLPNIVGAIDRTHIPILPPNDGYQDYVNKKGWPSIVTQAVVDNNYLFRDVSVKSPGGTHDEDVFKNSGLFNYSSQLIPNYASDVNGMQTPFMLIGNPAYPLLSWLMKPYTGSLDPEEESFNCYISSGRIVGENGFVRLKCRWRCLLRRMDVDPGFVPFIVLACTILHNFAEKEKQPFLDSWYPNVQNEVQFPQPQTPIYIESIPERNIKTRALRENLKNFLKNNFPLRR
ncbi:putative nuclease HARBI1 [Rhagoletis pomonella]|uniref:putative nuclease HARBI1 n=1 Tax=Rhagoletis pomonella TaxID=28610 RepID=UPI00178493FF|nr:putative nuclease HARBI1 [Rhagoletis pomonella]